MTEVDVSVIVPAYRSSSTIGGCLEALQRQTYRRFDVTVVDSGPDDECAAIVPARLPRARYVRVPHRMLPHAALNCGVERSSGALLAFLSADLYPRSDWLERLVATHRSAGAIVAGSMACHGARWLDRGIHLCKFSPWLPAGSRRSIAVSPSGNMLVDRATFERAGGFRGELLLGDVELSWRFHRRGCAMVFEPAAVVHHHHLQTLGGFLRERYVRGVLYGELRCRDRRDGPAATLAYLAASVTPVRFVRILALVARDAARAKEWSSYLATLPVIAAGEAAWIAGESVAHAKWLRRVRSALASMR